MMLADQDIRGHVASGRIRFAPSIADENIRPTGVRLHLAGEILVPVEQSEPLDLSGRSQPGFLSVPLAPDGYVLRAGRLVLGASVEHVSADADLVCQIDGRSTLARLGLLIHCSSTTFDHIQSEPRSVTFELANVGPFDLLLRDGLAVGLLSFVRLSAPILQSDHKQYEGQSGPTAPRLGYGENLRSADA